MPTDVPNIRFRGRNKGFTLLEVLVAMSILAVVMGLIFGTFEGVFSNSGHVNAGSDIYKMADNCLKRIGMDLKSLHVMQQPAYQVPDTHSNNSDLYRIEGKTESFGGGSFARMRFTSLAHLPMGGRHREGIAEIVYYIQEVGSGNYVLRRADRLYPYPETFEPTERDPVLCEQVLSFKLIYFDKEGREHEAWDSEADNYEYSTPKTIAIHLKVGNSEFSYDFATEIMLPMHRFVERKR
jgi:general secretion pathway protein J